MTYKNKTHERIFNAYVTKCPYRLPSRTLAAIYLLSADRNAWKRMKKSIHKKEIAFKDISLAGTSTLEYTIIKVALDIYEDGIKHIGLFDLGDEEIISAKTLEIIFQAIKIARNGYAEIDINKVFN